MNTFNILSIICGIVLGFTITFQLNRLLSFNTTKLILLSADLGIPHKNTNQTESPQSALTILNNEKYLLYDKIRKIENKIQHILGNNDTYIHVNNPSIKQCKYSFKVYIYDIPSSIGAIRISHEARRNHTLHVCHKCILEQFSLEYIIYDFFTSFCGRTLNPDDADFFYLPLVRDAEFRLTLQDKGTKKGSRAPSNSEMALLDILEKNETIKWNQVFNVTDKYWHRNHGGDHIIVMPAPVTNIRHETSQRGFFHYMVHLHTPIFLNLEYSLDFVKEYPYCSTMKNIVMPYPTIDPELYNGKLFAANITIKRNYLLYYAGGLHGDCIEVRKAMKILIRNSTLLPGGGIIPPNIKSNQAEREHGFLAAIFCPIPIGDSPSSKRMYDVINFGCIPVVLSNDLVWAYSDQTGGTLQHSKFSIQIPQSIVHFNAKKTLSKYSNNKLDLGILPSGTLIYDLLNESYHSSGEFHNDIYVNPLVQILKRVSQKDILTLQQNMRNIASFYRYYQLNASMYEIPIASYMFPNGGAIDMLTEQLSIRKQKGIRNILNNCKVEKSKKHKYNSRYSCDNKDKVGSLIRKS